MNKRAKKTLSIAIKLFWRLLIATVLCAILYVSMNVITAAFFSDVVGYQVYEQSESGEVSQVGEDYYYKEGEKHVTAEDLDLKDNQLMTSIRVVPEGKQTAMNWITQLLLLVLLGVFPYHVLWSFGNRDDTNTRYRGQRPDPWRGVKVGLLAIAPFALIWLCLLISKFGLLPEAMLQVYRITAFPYYPLVSWLLGSATSSVEIAWWRIGVLLLTYLFVPIMSGISYRLGGNQFSLTEFITFKKNKESEDDKEI